VINDYIAQISPVSMEPLDELQRAQMKAWSEYSGRCMEDLMQVQQAADKDSFEQANKALIDKFQILSEQLTTDGPFFYGQQFTTIDSSYAPLFFRMKTLSELFEEFSLDGLPEKIEHWMTSLLDSEPLKKSIMGDFPTIYRRFIANQAGGKYVDSQLG